MRPDGADLTAKVNGHLDYVSQLAKQLGMADPVESYLVPVLGKWSDLHDEATRWRAAATVATSVTSRLTKPLVGLDAAWQGADADSFLEYMQGVGLAGHDMAAALGAMADALDKTADGIRQIAGEMVDMLADTADQSSDAMTLPAGGAARAKQHLDEVTEPTGQLYESVRDVLDAFVKLCNGVQGGQLFSGITMAHKMPTQNWSPPVAPPPPTVTPPPASTLPPAPPPGTVQGFIPPPTSTAPAGTAPAGTAPAGTAPAGTAPAGAAAHGGGGATPTHGGGGGAPTHGGGGAVPAGGSAAPQQTGPPAESSAVAAPSDSPPTPVPGEAAAAAGAPAAASAGGGGMPMGGMGGMRGGGGGDAEHKTKIRVSGDPRDLFGKPDRTTPPVIGEE